VTERAPGWDRQVETREERYIWERARQPLTAFGETKTLQEWADDPRCTIDREALRTRIAIGWDIERAVSAKKSDPRLPPLTYEGRTLTLRGWADLTGIRYHTLYRRLTSGMDFEAALDAGPQQKVPVREVTAFGETKSLTRWSVDKRASVSSPTISKRLDQGWDTERAITQPASVEQTRFGESYTAFGRTMPLSDWAQISGQPYDLIRSRMGHNRTLETALQALGWIPPWEADAPQVLRVAPSDLQPGDLVVSANDPNLITVRRLPETAAVPEDRAPGQRERAARSRNALPGLAAERPIAADYQQPDQTPAAPRSARPVTQGARRRAQ
jgi:hypothetical protein